MLGVKWLKAPLGEGARNEQLPGYPIVGRVPTRQSSEYCRKHRTLSQRALITGAETVAA